VEPVEAAAPPGQDRIGRLGGWASETLLMAALPGLMIAYFAANKGGYFAASVGLAVTEV
jgi:hypothetical protein